MRVAHDRYAFGQRSGGLLVVQRNTRLYLLEANGDLDRADDVDGTDAGEVAAFLAGEELVDAYDAEVGGSTVSYPLVADSRGKWPVTWHESGRSYDEYCPDDPVKPLRRWEGVSAQDIGGRELAHVETVLPSVSGFLLYPSGTASNTPMDVPDLTLAHTAIDTRPFEFRVRAHYALHASANSRGVLFLADESNVEKIRRQWRCTGAAAEEPIPDVVERITPVAGTTYTRKVRFMRAAGAGDITLVAGAVAPWSLAVIQR